MAEFLFETAQLTPCRYVVNGLAIIETMADLRAGRADISINTTPKGRSILQLRHYPKMPKKTSLISSFYFFAMIRKTFSLFSLGHCDCKMKLSFNTIVH